jgi:hypothetical protein
MVVPRGLTTLYPTGMPTYGSQTITLLVFITIPPITHIRKCCGGAYLHRHPKLRLIPSTQRMDEEGRGKGIYFYMTSLFRLAGILDGPPSRTKKAGEREWGNPTLKFISL